MNKCIEYDPDGIRKLAARLYRRSTFVLYFWPVLFGVFGFGASQNNDHLPSKLISIGIIIVLGYLFGTLRSMMLRAQAQTLLCQMQIEENTRAE